jgi:hypothetical protein
VVFCKPGPCSPVSWPVSFFGRGILRGKCLWAMRRRCEARIVGLFGRPPSVARRQAGVSVCGDFNAARFLYERWSSSAGSRPLDHISFNRFIEDTFLVDLPLSGRKFTWYNGDGITMSRLDRFLISEEWCLTWANCTQTA